MKVLNRDSHYHARHLDRLRLLDGRPLASFRSRVVAFIIDILVILFFVILIGLPAAYVDFKSGATDKFVVPFDPFHSFKCLIALLLYFGLLTYRWNGYTLGKRLLRIRVISLKSDKISLWQALERALGYGASALEAGFGFLQAAWYDNRQAVHDRIAETAVVKESRNVS